MTLYLFVSTFFVGITLWIQQWKFLPWIQAASFVWWIPIVLVAILFAYIFRSRNPEASALDFGKKKLKKQKRTQRKTTFADVAGYQEAKAELQELIHFLRFSERYVSLGSRIPRGVLLIGPPGTGKTLLARAVAGEADVPFFSISGAEFVEMYVGLGAARVRDLFEQAKYQAPCIIFIDELDALGRSRGSHSRVNPHEEREQTLNQLLVEMDGFNTSQLVVVMAATNRPEILDPALLRSGRFDRQIVIDYPIISDREEILKTHSAKLALQGEISFGALSKATAGFSGADLENLVNEASLLAIRRQSGFVTNQDFQSALDRLLMGAEQTSRKLSFEEKRQSAYYECGRALGLLLLSGKDTALPKDLQKISIIPRNRSATEIFSRSIWGQESDRTFFSENEIRNRVMILLSGRAALEEWLHLVSSKAQEDLQRATDLARKMVIEYGMGHALGLQSFPQTAGPFLGRPALQELPLSSESLKEVEKEVKDLLHELYEEVRGLIRPYKDRIKDIVDELIEHETVDGAKFQIKMQALPEKAARKIL